jgi:hypothetical protein
MPASGAQVFSSVPLSDLAGRPAALRAEAGGALVVVGHGDCETTRQALRHVQALYARRTRPVAVAAVLQDEPDDARALVDELGLTYPVLLDRDPFPLGAHLALTGVPTTLVVDAEGAVAESNEALRRADLERYATRLGVPPPFFAPAGEPPALRPG